jgi:putative nucleotidyltransferase with HDIG domain
MRAVPPYRHLSRAARVFIATVVVGGLVVVAVGWMARPLTWGDVPPLLYLGVGAQIAALLPIRWRNGTQSVVDPLLIATGLIAPGAGPGLLAWLATFDGRVPGRGTTWWILLFNRGMLATAHVIPSLVATRIDLPGPLGTPVHTAVYVALSLSINYLLMARSVSLVQGTSFWATLEQNVAGLSTLTSTAVLGFSGGVLFLLLAQVPHQYGYFMAPALFGFILAVRSNVADAQRQTELKDQTLELAAQALDARDRYTESHSIRVAELAGRLGEHLDMNGRECELLRTAGSLHDLGKIGVRDDILNKPGPLTPDEWEIMRRHPDIGADMIAQHTALMEVAPLVRHHHERWNGAGYPAGLKGEAIPFGARILSVADSFDTITGARLYRRSLMTPVEAVEDISQKAGIWYDPDVVDALREVHGLAPSDVEDRPAVRRRTPAWRLLGGNRDLTKLLASMSVSALGDPLTQVAALISVYAATNHDAIAVALVLIAQAIGVVLMTSVLGGLADRFHRRSLVVVLECVRGVLIVATPFVLTLSVWLIVPILFIYASINSVVQPARQAAVPRLVPTSQIGQATAIVTATLTASNAIGYGIAGLVFTLAQSLRLATPVNVIFVAAGATFFVAALLVLTVKDLGGGTPTVRLTGSLIRSLRLPTVRPHLLIGAVAAFLFAISLPALVALAYRLSPTGGGQVYSGLEVVLSIGLFVGSIAVARTEAIGSLRTAGIGLLLTGIFSLAMTLSPVVAVVAVALFVASIGNPVFVISNQTALMEASDESSRGGVMASRYGLVQAGGISGLAIGGVITNVYSPPAAFGVLSIGLILLGMFAVAAGTHRVNPLLGQIYEETIEEPEPAAVAEPRSGAAPANGSEPAKDDDLVSAEVNSKRV